MQRDRFVAELRRWCADNSRDIAVWRGRGKGSHYRVMIDGKKSTIKHGDLSPTYMEIVLKQLGLPKDAV